MSDESDAFDFEESDFSFDDESVDEFENEIDSDFNSEPKTNIIRSLAVEYRVSTLEEFVFEEFVLLANQLHQKLENIDCEDLFIMLHQCKWQSEDLIDKYYDDRQALMDQCGLVENKHNRFRTADKFTCVICCEEYDKVETLSLSCDHEYCIYCYGAYVKVEVPLGNLIRCMEPTCNLSIPHVLVQELYGKTELAENSDSNKISRNQSPSDYSKNVLLIAATKVYISGRKRNLKWCPAPDCSGLVEVLARRRKGTKEYDDYNLDFDELLTNTTYDITDTPIVCCPTKDHEFCFACQKENHLPCPCWIVKKWVQKCNDDSETANWIHANTQACPKCSASIEKNGGCNHMICRTCQFEFCWICSKDWYLHGTSYYKCSSYDPNYKDNLEKSKKTKRQSLQRYLHYYKRFTLHESSMKGDIKTLEIVHKRMKTFMEVQLKKNRDILSWVDVEYLKDAFRALTNGRKALKWAYCCAFYFEVSNYADVFEQIQEYLSKSVEDLSRIFEQIISKKNDLNSTEIIIKEKQEIINLSSLIVKRQKTLIECVSSGLNENLLKFEER